MAIIPNAQSCNQKVERCSPATWTGVFLGLLLGVVIGSTLFQRNHDLKFVFVPPVSAACATLFTDSVRP